MSLDVCLISKEKIRKNSSGIFVRDNGQTREITREEWNRMFPDREPLKFESRGEDFYYTDQVFSANITHNLNSMATAAGIYHHLWRPEEIEIGTAGELIDPLREGLHRLKTDPEKYKKFNPENGWGSDDVFVKFLENYLDACYKYPDAKVQVDR